MYKLNKAINGLKQVPRTCYTELKDYLVSIGFVKSQLDSSFFILYNSIFIVYVLIYVDNIFITGNQSLGVKLIIDHLSY